MAKKFKTKYDEHKRVFMNPGEQNIVVRKARKKDGVLYVEDTKEKFPLYDYIQSFADSVNIEILLKRFAAGDQSVIQQFAQKTLEDYKDLTMIPDNINDMMNFIHDGQVMFDELPAEKKELFENNFEKFIQKAGSDEWIEKMGFKNEKVSAEDTGVIEDPKVDNPA